MHKFIDLINAAGLNALTKEVPPLDLVPVDLAFAARVSQTNTTKLLYEFLILLEAQISLADNLNVYNDYTAIGK